MAAMQAVKDSEPFAGRRKSIENVPAFRPTEAEFAAPLEYFARLAEAGRTYGILRVVTPNGWRPKDWPKTKEPFDSYRQAIHALRAGQVFGTGGEEYTVEGYRSYADRFEEKWIKDHPDLKLDLTEYVANKDSVRKRFSQVIEAAFWEMAEGESSEKLEVDYASNHPVTDDEKPENGWNLTSLLHEEGNLLNKTGVDIPGVTKPWLYFGCLFSTFCWHAEDHFLYSVNYLHAGASKIWYGIPSTSAAKFEECLTSRVATRSMKADILNRLTMMLSPYKLPKDVEVFKAVQNPGDIILTFPQAFHAGYNEGWNCAQAVNFAMMDWVMFGQKAVTRYQMPTCDREELFSHDKLLWRLTEEQLNKGGKLTPELREAVIDACQKEIQKREKIRLSLYKVRVVVAKQKWDMDWESWTCSECRAPLFFSYTSCPCRVRDARVLCFNHAVKRESFRCGCLPHLCLERTDQELSDMITTVKSHDAAEEI